MRRSCREIWGDIRGDGMSVEISGEGEIWGDTDRDGRVLDHPNTLREHDAARKIAAKSLGDRDAVGAEAGGAACRVEESDGRALARHDVASEGVVPVAAWQPPRAVC